MTEIEGIAPAIAQALNKRGYTNLTPVQKAMLAPELENADALVSAQTGSGKTVAFGLALAPTLLGPGSRFNAPGAPLALVIAPTRELALQVKRELEWMYELTGATITSCVGGMDIRTERRALERGAHIIVGTPGRLCDHINRKALDLSNIRAIVLDEADEMLDLGFREDLEFILESSPDSRRTLMFSATVPPAIAKMAGRYQRDAVRVETTAERKQHVDIEYRTLLVVPSDRENAIINTLRYYDARNTIVFCSTRAAVNHLTARLNDRGFPVVALSGELSQNERTHALQAMRDGRARVCVATDVAARGIDLPGLELVIHADLPTNGDTLLHRSGRTGRAGKKGVSAIIVPVNQRRKAERLLEAARVTPTWARPPSADEIIARDGERMMSESVLIDPPSADEKDVVAQLLEQHGPERVAAAFLRLFQSGRSAPEDLVEVSLEGNRKPARRDGPDAPPRERPAGGNSNNRSDFSDSSWFSLSVGRKQNAEPRWLIPMLCRFGNLTRDDIGAIRMQPQETWVELSASAVDRFEAAIGRDLTLEKGIRVKPMEGAPEKSQSSSYEDRPARPKGPRKDFSDAAPPRRNAAPAGRDDRAQKTDDKPWGNKSAKPRKPGPGKPANGAQRFEGKKPKPRRDD